MSSSTSPRPDPRTELRTEYLVVLRDGTFNGPYPNEKDAKRVAQGMGRVAAYVLKRRVMITYYPPEQVDDLHHFEGGLLS
jgi:hypothetical protein